MYQQSFIHLIFFVLFSTILFYKEILISILPTKQYCFVNCMSFLYELLQFLLINNSSSNEQKTTNKFCSFAITHV